MRKRRAERCLLRAGVALEAGVLEDAREAIAEARELDPYNPQLESLEQELASAASAPPLVEIESADPIVEPERATGGGRWVAIAATLVLLSGLAGWLGTSAPGDAPAAPIAQSAAAPLRMPPPAVSAPAATAVGAVVPAVDSGADAAPAPASVEPADAAPVPSVAAAPANVPESPRSTERLTTPPPVRNEPSATAATTGVGVDARTTAPQSSTLVELPPSTGTARPAVPPVSAPIQARDDARGANVAPEVVRPAPSIPEPSAPVSQPPPVPPPAAPVVASSESLAVAGQRVEGLAAAPASASSAVERPSDERLVRGVLSRYEWAYNRLDATAAGAVWPTVDRRALARAFSDLESQNVSLGRCDVRVSGSSARAECTGVARWTPKVGGGAQSSSRRWQFDLRNDGGEWIISQASMR